jgi:hypothetical protein
MQTAAALVVGWGGALVTARIAAGEARSAVGSLGVLLGVAVEVLVWWRLGAAPAPLSRLFLTIATALFLGGSGLLLAEPALAWAAVAVAAVCIGARSGRRALELQGAVLAATALLGSGALAVATAALLRPASPPPSWSPVALASLAAAAICLAPLATAARERSLAGDLAAALLLALLVWTGVGAVASTFQGFAPGVRAAVGTTLLAACAVPLAHAGRGARLPAAAWLVYPILGVTTFKLLLVDLPNGRPITLFVSFAALGGALLAAARAARRAP